MATTNPKCNTNLNEKRLYISSVCKKKLSNKLSPRSNNENKKVNLQRGKIPLNWNKFVEENNTTTQKPTSKYPKNVSVAFSAKTDTNSVTSLQACSTENKNVNSSMSMINRCVAIDCEMVGIGDGSESIVARASLVDETGACIYDTFVKPDCKVVDYRTAVSGVRPEDLETGKDFIEVQNDVYNLLKGKLLIGHALKHDLKVLKLSHPRKYIRDTSKYKIFREQANGRTPSLKLLSSRLLNMNIQAGEHSSIEDARATMLLYLKFQEDWEAGLRTIRPQ